MRPLIVALITAAAAVCAAGCSPAAAPAPSPPPAHGKARLAAATPSGPDDAVHPPRKAKLRYEIHGRSFPLPLVTGTIAGQPVLMLVDTGVGSSRVDLQACKLEYSIVSPK